MGGRPVAQAVAHGVAPAIARGFARVARGGVVLLAVWLAACAPTAAPQKLEVDATPIAIVPPPQPLKFTAVVSKGSFVRSHLSPEGMQTGFADALRENKVFASVAETFPPGGEAPLELELAASDYGEPNAYTLELQVAVLRQRKLLTTYFTKQSVRQSGRSQLTVGPEQLRPLAERAIRDLVRQLAADSQRIAGF